MKLVVAMIQPHKLPDVKEALFEADIHKMTVTNVLGCGQQKGFSETYRGVVHEVNLLKKIRFEVAVNEEFVDATVKAIIKGAKSGQIGDGKIFVLNLERCVRIRTGEDGKDAIGQFWYLNNNLRSSNSQDFNGLTTVRMLEAGVPETYYLEK